MGWNIFGRDRQAKTNETRIGFDEYNRSSTSGESSVKNPISVFSPTSFNDVEKIIDALKGGKPAIVHLNDLKTDTAIRVLDMLSGAVYAIEGGVYEMEKNIFMFSPTGVEVK